VVCTSQLDLNLNKCEVISTVKQVDFAMQEPGVNSTGLNGTAVQDLYDHTNITVALIGSADFDNIRAWVSTAVCK
jgi:hypothetical protein